MFDCPTCKGRGKGWFPVNNSLLPITCPDCGGSGVLIPEELRDRMLTLWGEWYLCHCEDTWTDRGLHRPDCVNSDAEDFTDAVLAVLVEYMKEQENG